MSTAWPSCTAKSPVACFPARISRPLPTAFTRPPGPRPPCRMFSTATFLPGGKIISACAVPLVCLRKKSGPRTCSKHELFQEVQTKTGLRLDPEAFTIGFARRATGYKRADLILSDLDRLREIAKIAGKFQIV